MTPYDKIIMEIMYIAHDGWHDDCNETVARKRGKIAQIKRLRSATGCGLKEAKVAVEASIIAIQRGGEGVCMYVTPEQFGRLYAQLWEEPEARELVRITKLNYVKESTLDFTR